MFLTSLRLRGFKSFADATTLDVEPGLTVVVGPNGSGKSNVVDALAWVLGTTSAKTVRGGAMADVIFAGSPTRAPHGQARVEITIDNSRGQLGDAGVGTARSAQGYREVRVARTVAASGDSLYEINGQEVRALDVQELLSDTGLGRELHTIVGQGQLDEILQARPEERRRYLEEAAGISKHRRRRERAVRKLAHVDEHTERLQSVLRELRRQLRPLERQAEAAQRQRDLQEQLRATRLRLAAHDLAVLQRLAAADHATDVETIDEQQAATERLRAARARQQATDARLAELEPRAREADAGYHRLAGVRVRLQGVADLVDAKRRHLLDAVEEPLAGRPPDELRAQAARLQARAGTLRHERAELQAALETAVGARRGAEAALRAHEVAQQAEQRRRAEQRERVLRWEGELSALRGAIAAAEAETGRVTSHREGLEARLAATAQEIDEVRHDSQQLESREAELGRRLETAEADVAAQQRKVDDLRRRQGDVERQRSSEEARADVLRAAVRERDGGQAALLDGSLAGVLGPVASRVRVEPEHDRAVAAALRGLDEAVAVASGTDAGAAVAWLRATTSGRATVLPAALDAAPAAVDVPDGVPPAALPSGAQPVAALLHPADGEPASAAVTAALRQQVRTTLLVDDWDAAVRGHATAPAWSFVTPLGDLAGPAGYVGGAATATTPVFAAAAADAAEERAEGLAAEQDRLADALAVATTALDAARAAADRAVATLHESDARITGAAERLARLTRERQSLADQRDIVAGQEAELAAVLDRDRDAWSQLHSRGPESEPVPDEVTDTTADQLTAALGSARDAELDLRIRVERVSEQVRHLDGQATELGHEAEEIDVALAAAARRRERRRDAIARCGRLAEVAGAVVEAVGRAVTAAEQQRDSLTADVDQTRAAAHQLASQVADLTEQAAAATEARHAAELRRADLERRLATLTDRLDTDFGVDPDALLADHPAAAHADRGALVTEEDTLVRRLGLLGRINPLALEEFEALERRHAFLSDQLDELRRSKRDLMRVCEAVDERIRSVFAAAFRDVAREFEHLFETLFPGGHGRLVLDDPDDLLATGVDVEAKPPGKQVTRLSLLSGGERSLTVLAFVFAIFRARPSPFYVLDEVDAALDDVNLQRLLRVIEQFRGEAQILMVTHQHRSMEAADVLYGVTMGPDAVTKVVADRPVDATGDVTTPSLDAAAAPV